MIQFFIDCEPPRATSQQKGACVVGGKIRFFKKARIQAVEDELSYQLYKYAPSRPIEGPIKLAVSWRFPLRKSDPRGVESIPHIGRPDLDNIFKLFCDCMTKAGFWVDDSQICTLVLTKRYSEKPGIYVKVDRA